MDNYTPTQLVADMLADPNCLKAGGLAGCIERAQKAALAARSQTQTAYFIEVVKILKSQKVN